MNQHSSSFRTALVVGVMLLCMAPVPLLGGAQDQRRARDLGIPFDGTPGCRNAITDVAGVEVGHTTLKRGKGCLRVGKGPVRTGVTAICPLGKTSTKNVFAGRFSFNGAGEMTRTVAIDEFGVLSGPVLLTNTLSVGTVQAAVIEWNRLHVKDPEALYSRSIPLVAETWDGFLNDIYGQHVRRKDVFKALDSASRGPVEEGNVGGGTGTITYEFKGGIGTSSRVVKTEQGRFTVGVLVQSNFGLRYQLRIAGVPVGEEIQDLMPKRQGRGKPKGGSIIVVVATDAPLLPVQLDRAARRPALALGRTGSIGMDDSGDIFLAFSTGNRLRPGSSKLRWLRSIDDVNPLFEGIVQATEEAIVNAMVAGEKMVGIDGNVVYALPHCRLQAVLRKYHRLQQRGLHLRGAPRRDDRRLSEQR